MRVDFDRTYPIVHILSAIDLDGRFRQVKSNPLIIQEWEAIGDNLGWTHFKKNLGRKGFGKVKLFAMDSTKEGLEFKVEIYLPSYCEWYTMFEGFLETVDDYNTIMKCLGLNK